MPDPQNDQSQQVQGLPPGAELRPIQQLDTSQIKGLPPGAELRPVQGAAPAPLTPDQAHAARAARANSSHPEMPTVAEVQAQQPGTLQNIAEGAGKSAASGMQGVTKLVNKVLPSSMQLPVPGENMDLQPKGVAQNVGAIGEQTAEWAIGEEAVGALSELAKASKYLKTPQMLQAFLARSPKIANALATISHGIAIGGAQGAVHGAAEDDAAGGAKAGAIGGGLGAAAGAVISGAGAKVLDKMGIGLSTEEAVTRAAGGSLNVGTQNWPQTVERAMPLLKDAKFSTVGEFADAVHDTADSLWKDQIQPMIDKNATVPVDMRPIKQAILDSISQTVKDHVPNEAKAVEEFANTFNKPKTVADLNKAIEVFNARLKNFYRATGENKSAFIKSDSEVGGTEAAVSSMRDALIKTLENKGEQMPGELRQQYGALKEMERVFDKRATVDQRRAKLTMNELLAWTGGAAALAEGATRGGVSPLHAAGAAALPVAASALKYTQAPTTLLKRAASSAAEDAGAPTVGRMIQNVAGGAAKGAVEKGTPAAASQAARWVHFLGKDGNEYRIHPDDLKTAQDRGLVDKVLGPSK